MSRFGSAMERIDERIPGIDLPLLSVSQTRGVLRRSELTDRPQRADSLDAYKVCRANDIVFNKMSIRAGAMGVAQEDGLVTYHYEVMRAINGSDPRYVVYVMKSAWFTEELIKRERGIGAGDQANVRTTEVPFSVLKTIDCHLPEPSEQCAIADFLDRETAQIDALIDEQQRLIDLLRARRVAVVDSLLTAGAKSSKAQIATGNSWIPSLPDGWQAIRAKHVLSFGPSNGVSPEAGPAEGVKSLSLGAIRDGRVNIGPEVTKVVDRAGINVDDYRLYPNDILLVRGNGNVDLVARAGLVGADFATDEYIYPDLLIRVRVNSSMLPEFFVWACNATATRAQVRAQARTAVGTFKVAGGMVRSLVLPLPPLDEQDRIIDALDAQTSKIDILIAESERFVELARERRSALITAAVTGQIEVRNEVA
ncbi:restriction endonuclease subunit S [Mycolicibacterium alvei]|uniref:Restriction modification system DNA specificity domain-containing protein n=1 Tax=Mycolicibacterium alvei TaxID=67081 RepID=A0A6N4V4D3_9MYCO|nr:restriction endonuclease subunit S [Mycolicibacterium alvei]MCV6998851.1 restriction endonuclease subunit S [Mycolicibacterium alvei]BBX30714.1 restriction modification system DNA specificity domain-containing protein [Mycolicibacterium alvei]